MAAGELDENDPKLRALTRELSGKEEQRKLEKSETFVEEKKRQGRPGKGFKDGYELFCLRCMREYEVKVDECSVCKGALIPREQRQAELKGKVKSMIRERDRVKASKARYAQHQALKKQGKIETSAGATDYTAWDFWEPDTDSDEEPILPNTPEFKAMEADLIARNERREAEAREANRLKQIGNKAFKKGKLKEALEWYDKAVKTRKDLKSVYTNRALVYLKLKKWTKAAKDCTTVLDIWEFLEDMKPARDEIVIKAFVRRAQAHRAKKRYAEAVDDLKRAVDMRPGVAFNEKLLRECTRDLEDAKLAEEALKAVGVETQPTQKSDRKAEADATGDGEGKDANGQDDEILELEAADDEKDGNTTRGTSSSDAKTSSSTSETKSAAAAMPADDAKLREIASLVEWCSKNGFTATPPETVRQLDLLRGALTRGDDRDRVLFRKLKGFRYVAALVFGVHPVDTKSAPNGDDAGDAGLPPKPAPETTVPALNVLAAACTSDHNRRHAAKSQRVLKPLLALLESPRIPASAVTAGYDLLAEIARDADARKRVCSGEGASERVAAIVVRGIRWKGGGAGDALRVQAAAATALCNLSHDFDGLRSHLAQRGASGDALEALVELLSRPLEKAEPAALDTHESALSALANILNVPSLRAAFVQRTEKLRKIAALVIGVGVAAKAIGSVPDGCDPPLLKALGVVLNCSVEAKALPALFGPSDRLVEAALALAATREGASSSTRERALLLVRRAAKFLASKKRLGRDLVGKDAVKTALGCLCERGGAGGTPPMREHVAALLAHCVADDEGRLDVEQFEGQDGRKGLEVVASLATDARGDATATVANAAITVSKLAADRKTLGALGAAVPGLVAALRREGKGAAFRVMQKNAAVALAKLAPNPDNLRMIRALHGMELMYRVAAQ